jgi:hypothetical protein
MCLRTNAYLYVDRTRYDCCVVDQCLQTAVHTGPTLDFVYMNVDECKNPHLCTANVREGKAIRLNGSCANTSSRDALNLQKKMMMHVFGDF